MRKLLGPLMAMICLSFTCYAALNPYVRQVEKDVRAGKLKQRYFSALDTALRFSAKKLAEKHEDVLAKKVLSEWKTQAVFFSEEYTNIGDHPPLIAWLARVYDAIESKLGVEICKFFHISDIKTLNYCIPIAFNPCSVDIYEFARHMVDDSKYYGLYPVLTFWAADLACMGPTLGVGFLVCSPIATLAEWSMDKFTARGLSDDMYHLACN